MAEAPAFESPVTRLYEPGERAAIAGDREVGLLTLQDVSPMTKIMVRAAPGTNASRRMATPFGTSQTEEGVLVIGQRPHEWMLLGPELAIQVLIDSLDQSGHVSVIDVTHSRALFRLTGADAAAVFEKLCNLDWSDHMTPAGAAVSAPVARVNCDIARNDRGGTRSYLISCDRSYGQYLFDTILDAGHEFAIHRKTDIAD